MRFLLPILTTLLCLLIPCIAAEQYADKLRYDQCSWLCSHNAMSNSAENWLLPNQKHSIAEQLERGIHAQMWDIWPRGGKGAELMLRHGNGKLFDPGRKKLATALTEVKNYLSTHPHAIITLIWESYAEEAKLLKAIEAAGLKEQLYRHAAPAPWPTLGKLREANTRLIILIDKPTDHFSYLWEHAVETDFNNSKPESMSNALKRGKAANALFILNHFVTPPSPAAAAKLNTATALAERAAAIEKLYARRPNFIVIDFAEGSEQK